MSGVKVYLAGTAENAAPIPCRACLELAQPSHAARFVILVEARGFTIVTSACDATLANEVARICEGQRRAPEPAPAPSPSARPTVKP